MKKILFYFNFLLFAFVLTLTSCKDGDEIDVFLDTYEVEITLQGESSATSVSAQFKPTSGAAYVKYAIGSASDRPAFLSGSLSGIKTNNGDETFTADFDGLKSETEYTLYARAYDEKDVAYAVSSIQVETFTKAFSVTTEYMMDKSAGFRIKCSNDYYQFSYALGKASDRAAFLNGSLEGITFMDDAYNYVVNYFDLTPENEYVFYCIGRDRLDKPTILFEIPITTYATGECPDVDISADIDIYRGVYTFKPNSLCGGIIAVAMQANIMEDVIYNKRHEHGDIIEMLEKWNSESIYGTASASKGNDLELELITLRLELDVPMEVYAVVLDNNMNVSGVKHVKGFSTPSQNPSAGVAEVDVEILDVTNMGAIYTLKPNGHTFGYLYETVFADWYDSLLRDFGQEEADEYLRTYMLGFGIWEYIKGVTETITHTEEFAFPGTRYYAVAIPMNENGPLGGGWGKITKVEFTTKY